MTEAESGVLGCVLIDSDSLYEVYDSLKPEMFVSEFCQDCFTEMLAMYDTGIKISVVELSMRLENRKYDKSYVGEQLKICMENAPTSVMMKQYADVVMREYRSRTVKNLFQRISFAPKDIDNTIAEVLTRFEELQQNQEVRCKTMAQIVEENRHNYFREVEKKGVFTGFKKMDEVLGILEGGDVTVIGARPGVGKSAFVAELISNIAEQEKKVGYFNLEMRDSQVYERMVAREAQLSLNRIRRAKAFLGDEAESFECANEKLSKYDVVVSTGTKAISEVRAESRHQKFDVIVIDYLQLVRSDKNYSNRASEVGAISKAIKSLASELDIPIIILSQLNREIEHRNTKMPSLSDLRESGDIEQDVSNAIFLWNLSDKDSSYKGANIAKNRMGVTSIIGYRFDGDHMKFEEVDKSFDEFLEDAKIGAGADGFANVDDRDSPF